MQHLPNGSLARIAAPGHRKILKGARVYGTIAITREDLIAQTLTGVLVVPQGAVRNSQGDNAKPFAYKIEGGQLSVSPVQLGVVDEARGLVEVKGGLAERDEVVVGNVGTLGRGMKVQIIGSEGTSARGGDAAGQPAADGAGRKGRPKPAPNRP